jgi:exosortase
MIAAAASSPLLRQHIGVASSSAVPRIDCQTMNPVNTLWADLKTRCAARPATAAAGAIVAAAILVSYQHAFRYLYDNWSTEDYGYCFLVPPFAAFLLWYRRGMLQPLPDRGSWWGLAFLAVCGVLRFLSVYVGMITLEPLSLIPLFAGLIVLLAGWRGLHWAWPALLMLLFTNPPGRFQFGLRYELQHTATVASAFLLQSLGIPIPDPGNTTTIVLPSGPLRVEEACAGLRMLMLFQTACVGAAFVLRAPLWQRIIIVISGTPIAVMSNVMRITLTGVVQELFSLEAEMTGHVHDFAGLLMMPLALLFIWGEFTLLSKLFTAPPSRGAGVPASPLAGFSPGMPVPARGRRRRTT